MAMASKGLQVAALVAAVGTGFGLARWAAPVAPAAEEPHRLERMEEELRALRHGLEAAPRHTPAVVAGLDVPALKEDLRRMVREELQATKADAPASAPDSKARPEPPASQANLEAFTKAHQLMDTSVSARRWGDRERGEFLALRKQLTPGQTRELILKLAQAINSQQLRVSTQGPPL
ncbi:hypothetical protein [Corallococcus sp. M7]